MLGQYVQGPVTTDLPGRIFTIPQSRGMGITLYNDTGSTIAKGQPMMVGWTSTAGQEVQAIAPATMSSQRLVVIAMEPVAAETVGKFQFEGRCEDADVYTTAAGDRLQLLNGGTYLVVDGTTGSTTHTTATCAMALEANTAVASASIAIWLYGKEAVIAGS